MAKILKLERVREWAELKPFYKRWALAEDWTIIIDEETIVVDLYTWEYVFGLFNIDRDPKELTEILKSIKFITGWRSWGMLSTSRIFWYSPRVWMRSDYCNSTSLAKETPDYNDYICDYWKTLNSLYKRFAQDKYEKHMELTEKVLSNWKIKDTPFTSWIINKNNKLNYHYDAGNFKDVYSCMITIKDWIEGWYLMIPEYNVQVRTFNNSLLMFDGQSVLHGVSPIVKKKPDAYRYTIVYYSLKGMWKCLEPKEELARVKSVKTALYKKRKTVLSSKRTDASSDTEPQ